MAASTCSSVVVVDTGAGFSAARLQDMLPLDDTEQVLSRVQVYLVFSVFQLLTLVETLTQRIAQQADHFHGNLHLMVVDSITMLLSPLLGGHPQGKSLRPEGKSLCPRVDPSYLTISQVELTICPLCVQAMHC